MKKMLFACLPVLLGLIAASLFLLNTVSSVPKSSRPKSHPPQLAKISASSETPQEVLAATTPLLNSFSAIQTTSTNLMQTSSFEINSGNQPNGWGYLLDSSTGNTFVSQEGNRSGVFGLKFLGGGSGNFGIMQPDVKTVPGRTYTLSAYVKIVNAPSITLRLGFWNEYLNQEGEVTNFSFANTQDWQRISMTTTTPGLITDPTNEFPIFQVIGLTSGAVYIDDVQLEEGSFLASYNSAVAKPSTFTDIGDGSIMFTPGGNIYPTYNGIGSLGSATNAFQSLTLSNASIATSGGLTVTGATINGNLNVTGDFSFSGGLSGSINASQLLGSTWAIPGSIGSTTANTGAFTTLAASGGITFSSLTTNGGLLYTNGSGVIGQATAGSNGQCLLSNGGGAPSWSACPGASATNYWQLNNGAISPFSNTLDLLIGATASNAAKFAVLNINSGTPTASVSAGATGGMYVSAAGTLQTTANQGLTIGGNTTGNIILSPLNGSGTTTNTGTFSLSSGKTYQINNTDVLSATTLGSGITTSSLTTVGGLSLGTIASGFGTILTANTIQGTDITASGTTGFTGSGAGAGLTFNASGNHDITASSGTLRLGATTLTGAITGNSQNITGLSALSASGTITFSGFTSNGGILYTNGSGTVAQATAGTSAQCLFGGTTPSFGTCQSGSDAWITNSGALYPANSTLDLLIGGQASSSAKFAVLNVNNGTPTASVSAGTNGAAYLTADGTLATSNRQTLTIGNSSTYNTTGNILLNPNGTGNVGIGTTTPTSPLSIGSTDVTATPWINVGSGANASNYALGIAAGRGMLGYSITTGNMLLNSGTSKGIDFFVNGTSNSFATGTQAMTITSTATVGIGAATPLAKLDVRGNSGTTPVASVSGTTSFASFVVDNAGTGDLFTASSSGLNRFLITQAGNVGVGTTSPNYLLNVVGGTTGATTSLLTLRSNFSANNTATAMRFANSTSGTTDSGAAQITGIRDTAGLSSLLFSTYNGTALGERLRITGDGLLGLGNTSPAGLLDVNGKVTGKALTILNETGNQNILAASASGTTVLTINRSGKVTASGGFNGQCLASGMFSTDITNSCNMDVAEIYEASEDVEPGDLLVLDTTGDRVTVRRNHGGTEPLFGIVSSTPGLILGINDGQVQLGGESSTYQNPRKPAVALIGRVPLKVSTENGSIKVGDPLTASSLPGVAMKATTAGEIIGRALQDYREQDPHIIGTIHVTTRISWFDPAQASLAGFAKLDPEQASSAATLGLEKLDSANTTIAQTFNVLGRTTLNDLGVTGNITAGVLTIRGLDNDGTAAINTTAGSLKIQSNGLNGIDFLNGKLTIDTKGNFTTEGMITAKTIHADKYETQTSGDHPSAGAVTIDPGKTTVSVETNALTKDSLIFATPEDNPLAVSTQKISEKTFVIKIKDPQPERVTINWWLMN